jgi:hypothetical protein
MGSTERTGRQLHWQGGISDSGEVGPHLGHPTFPRSNVFDDEPGGLDDADGVEEVGPEPGAGTSESPPFPVGVGVTDVLAGEAARKYVRSINGAPVDGGDVAVVGDLGPADGQAGRRVLAGLGEPEGPVTSSLETEGIASDAAEDGGEGAYIIGEGCGFGAVRSAHLDPHSQGSEHQEDGEEQGHGPEEVREPHDRAPSPGRGGWSTVIHAPFS